MFAGGTSLRIGLLRARKPSNRQTEAGAPGKRPGYRGHVTLHSRLSRIDAFRAKHIQPKSEIVGTVRGTVVRPCERSLAVPGGAKRLAQAACPWSH